MVASDLGSNISLYQKLDAASHEIIRTLAMEECRSAVACSSVWWASRAPAVEQRSSLPVERGVHSISTDLTIVSASERAVNGSTDMG